MFGTYDLNAKISEEDIEIAFQGKGKRKRYYRNAAGEEIEKFIYAESGNAVVCPVEPVNLPIEDVTEHLLIELDKPLIVESGIKEQFFARFPVEIGVFLVDKKDVECIDIFSKTKHSK